MLIGTEEIHFIAVWGRIPLIIRTKGAATVAVEMVTCFPKLA